MLRARHCSFCGGDIPTKGRIDRKYCRPSCRTLAYRRRRNGGTERRTEVSSLLDAVRQMEQRLHDAALEMASIRQHFSSELGAEQRFPKRNVAERTETIGSESAALQEAERVQRQTAFKLREAEEQIAAQRVELAELSQRAERARREQEFAQQRVNELSDELRRQALQHEAQTQQSQQRPPWQVSQPTVSEVSETPDPWSPPKHRDIDAEPPPARSKKSQHRGSLPGSSRVRESKSLTSLGRFPNLNPDRTDHPAVVQTAYRVLYERLPRYIKDNRPELRSDFKRELAAEDSGIKRLCRLLARRIYSAIRRNPSIENLRQFAAQTVEGVCKQLDADPVQRALCGTWPKYERATLKWLAYEISVAIMGEWPPDRD